MWDTSVALQSTGVYWIALYDLLEEAGFEVYLVNARHTKSLPGWKSDVQEGQWLMKLHTYGLLPKSFRPPQEIRWLRSYGRKRQNHLCSAARCIQRMDKILTENECALEQYCHGSESRHGIGNCQSNRHRRTDPYKLAA